MGPYKIDWRAVCWIPLALHGLTSQKSSLRWARQKYRNPVSAVTRRRVASLVKWICLSTHGWIFLAWTSYVSWSSMVMHPHTSNRWAHRKSTPLRKHRIRPRELLLGYFVSKGNATLLLPIDDLAIWLCTWSTPHSKHFEIHPLTPQLSCPSDVSCG